MISLARTALIVGVFLAVVACDEKATQPQNPAAVTVPGVPYGANPEAGGAFEHDGVSLYYETYGDGPPLLIVHGNGASIGSMAAQIEFFKRRYTVIAMDSRDHGRSADSVTALTYEAMTDDLAALIDHLELGPVDVIGWSDGGIEALLLGVRHPDKVNKIVSMSPNLTPGPAVFYPEVEEFLSAALASANEEARNTAAGRRAAKVAGMMSKEPNIDFELIEQIEAPTLILAGDHDMVRMEHVVEIFNRLQNGQLGILPNSTHMAPYDNPELFNGTVERFLATPFTRRDRIADFLTSYERLLANLPR